MFDILHTCLCVYFEFLPGSLLRIESIVAIALLAREFFMYGSTNLRAAAFVVSFESARICDTYKI